MAIPCALALSLLVPEHARADGFDLTIALDGGAAWTDSRSQYLSFDDSSISTRGGVDRWGLTGAVQLALTTKASGILHLGGVLRVGVADAPVSAFVDQGALQGSIALGAMLRLESDDPAHGPYGGLWLGVVGIVPHGFGPAGGLDVGYRWTVAPRWSLGAGASLTSLWAFNVEEGDHGRYEYVRSTLVPSLHVRLVHAL